MRTLSGCRQHEVGTCGKLKNLFSNSFAVAQNVSYSLAAGRIRSDCVPLLALDNLPNHPRFPFQARAAMNRFRKHCRLLAPLMALVVLTSAGPADACCLLDWFHHTMYPPAPACAPACGSAYAPAPACCPQPACASTQYVPQTTYRTTYTSVPMTTYRPIVTADPCSGCPVTTMRPVTAFVQRAQLVPYTSYMPVTTMRPVVASYAPACSTCNAAPAPATYTSNYASNYYGVAATSYYQPATTAVSLVQPNTACSAGTTAGYTPAAVSSPTPGYLSPGYSTSSYVPANAAPGYSTPNYVPANPAVPVNVQPGYVPPANYPQQGPAYTIPPTPQPSITPTPGSTTQTNPPSAATQTFQTNSTSAAPATVRPIRDPNLDEQGQQLRPPAPRVNSAGDRTTMAPSARPWACSLIRYERPMAEPVCNADGWHAVN